MPVITRSGLSIRTLLALLALGLLVPVLLFSGLLLSRFSDTVRSRYGERTLETARRAALALDRELTGIEVALQSLATSTTLDDARFAAFQIQATEIARLLHADVILRAPDSRQLMNTRLPWGTSLPGGGDRPGDRMVIATGEPYVSDLIKGQVTGDLLVNVNVPVNRDGKLVYLLSASIRSPRFGELLASQELPPSWTTAIVDRESRVVVRGSGSDGFVGKSAAPDLLANATGRQGSWVGRNLDGTPVIAAYARSGLSDFRVVVGAPRAGMEAPLSRSLQLLTLYGIAAAAVSALLGLLLGRLVAKPLQRLAEDGNAIGRGEVPAPLRTPVQEIRDVAEALHGAAAGLRERAQARDAVEARLRDLAATLEARVEERTGALTAANAALVGEMSSRETAEGQLRQLQKMEAVGQLTGGIAHDFNNMLAVVISGLSLIQRRLAKGDTNIDGIIAASMDGATRAATLTARLLAFSRQQPLAPEPVEANRLVAGMSELLHRTLGETVRIETVLAAGLWRTHADPSQLENAVLNLAVNARDAMPDGGRLTIETANCHLDDAYSRQHTGVAAGQYAMVAVTDTGTGMPPEVIGKVFEPFFTTKEVGRGTGLGLSQVYGFVRQSGGHVKIYSEPGEGTTVKIYLPRFHGPVAPPLPSPAPSPLAAGSSREIVLVVEDEDRVRELSVAGLRELGYTAIHAANAMEALRQLDAHPEISLLFTDVVMPDMNGSRLAEEARRRRPTLKVLYTTGFTRNAVVHNGVLDTGVNLLPKPFALAQLAAKVREVLDAEALT